MKVPSWKVTSWIRHFTEFTKWTRSSPSESGVHQVKAEFTKWKSSSRSESWVHEVKVEFTKWKTSSRGENRFTKWNWVHEVNFHEGQFTKVPVPDQHWGEEYLKNQLWCGSDLTYEAYLRSRPKWLRAGSTLGLYCTVVQNFWNCPDLIRWYQADLTRTRPTLADLNPV